MRIFAQNVIYIATIPRTCHRKHIVLFSKYLEYHVLTLPCRIQPGTMKAAKEQNPDPVPPTRATSAMRAIHHIAPGSNMLHSFYVQSLHIYLHRTSVQV